MEKITSDELKLIRVSIQEALDLVAAKHNLDSLRLGNISYTETSFTSRVEAKRIVQGVNDQESLKTSSRTSILCGIIGLPLEAMDKTYIVNGKVGKIVEIKTANRSYPIIVETFDKKRYKLSVKQLENLKTV